MERVKIAANLRELIGTGGARETRRQGSVPAVVYGRGKNLCLSIPVASLKTLKGIRFSESAIIDLEIDAKSAKESCPVLIKGIQYNPVTEAIIHLDFLRVSLEEKIRVHVPITLKGEAKGVKDGGGVLAQILRELELEVLPLEIPEKIEVDVSELAIGFSLHVSDIKATGNFRILNDPQSTIVTVAAKVEEEAATAAVDAVPSEGPEVIKEKKDKEGETGEEGKETKEGAKEAKEEKPAKEAKDDKKEKKEKK